MPVLRLVKREDNPVAVRLLTPILSLVMAFALGWLILAGSGYDPVVVYSKMLTGSLGTYYAFTETIVKAIPLALAGLAVSLAFKMKLWNIGAEGQIYMGAFAASGLAVYWGDSSPYLLIPLTMAVAFLAGGIWGLIPGLLKAYGQVNETITTLMLNYVAIYWVDFLVFGPWKDPNSKGFPLGPILPASAQLPAMSDSRVHLGIIFVIITAVIIYLLIQRTRWGYEIRVIGESQAAARYAGINVARNIALVMLISGGIAGLAGMVEVAGITHRLQQNISPGYGYTAIIVAWLARLNPWAIILVAFLFGALIVGGFAAQIVGVSFAITQVFQGIVLFFILASELFLKYKIVWRKKEDK